MDPNVKKFINNYVTPLKTLKTTPPSTDPIENLRELAVTGYQKLILLLAPYFEQIAKENVKSKVVWTKEQQWNQLTELEKGTGSPFHEVLPLRIRYSIAGQFIKEFNRNIQLSQEYNELKLDIAMKTMKEMAEDECLKMKNAIVNDIIKLLTVVVQSQTDGEITLATFYRYLDHLRLSDSNIGSLDIQLRRLDKLQVLILSGNVIEELPLHFLPKTLRVLELSNNLISKVRCTKRAPPPLVILGLSTNRFSDGSQMIGLNLMETLLVLDLSNNDISNISPVLHVLKAVENLTCLCLRGNPCSTLADYKGMVIAALPYLQQLDGVDVECALSYVPMEGESILKPRKKVPGKQRLENKSHMLPSHCGSAELKIFVFRIMGISKPPPSKNKKSPGYFQFEVELPLLDKRLENWEKCHCVFELLKKCNFIPNTDLIAEQLPVEVEPPTVETRKKANDTPSVAKLKAKKTLKRKDQWEVEYGEFLSQDKLITGGKTFISEKIYWSPIMKPSNAIVTVPVESNDLMKLRDTLRSIITIRLYYREKGTGVTSSKLVAKILVPAEVPHWKDQYSVYDWNAKEPKMAKLRPNISVTKCNN